MSQVKSPARSPLDIRRGARRSAVSSPLHPRPSGLPKELLLLWNAKDGTRMRRGGTWDYGYAGPQYDSDGESVGAVPAIHYDAEGNLRGVWGGPAYAAANALTNQFYTGVSNISSTWTNPNSVVLTKITDNLYQSLTVGSTAEATSKTLVVGILSGAGPHPNEIHVGSYFSGGWQTVTAEVLSGPGVISGNPLIKVSGLSATIPTYIRFYRAAAALEGFNLHPGSHLEISNGSSATLLNLIVVNSPYVFPYVPPSTSVVSAAGTSSDNGLYLPLTDALEEAFAGDGENPATCTVAALVSMGVGSASLYNKTVQNAFTVANLVTSPIYWRLDDTTEAAARIVAGLDTSETIIYVNGVSWSIGGINLLCIQTGSDGTTYRVGYRRYGQDMTPIDGAIVWGSWSAYTGEFGNIVLRLMYGATIPVWARHLQIWNKGAVSDADILKWAERS